MEQHVDLASGGACRHSHDRLELDLRRRLQADGITECSIDAERWNLKQMNSVPAFHRVAPTPSGAKTAALPGPACTDIPLWTLSVQPDLSRSTR